MTATHKVATSTVLTISLLFGAIQCHYSQMQSVEETPEDVRYGWSPEAFADPDTQVWAAAQDPFQIVDENGQPIAQANENANVRLWVNVTAAAGQYPDEPAQQIGDCTSFGAAHAIQATLGSQIAAGQQQEFHQIFPPFLYGAARVLILKGSIRGDGCSGGAIAKAAVDFGNLRRDEPGLPAYSGNLARNWGQNGPPKEWIEKAAANKIRTVARLTSAADGRDATCNGYGWTIAGTYLPRSYRTENGRIVATMAIDPGPRPRGHQMAIDGYDGSSPDGKRYFHDQNSWGASAHPKPIDDSQAGGFWITESDMEKIIGQKDSWAFSGFEGFPSADSQRIFGAAKP